MELSRVGETEQRVNAHAESYRKLNYIATDKQRWPQGIERVLFLPLRDCNCFEQRENKTIWRKQKREKENDQNDMK